MDPRIARLIERFAYAKGDALLGQRGAGGTPKPEVLAGWALEKAGADPAKAVELLRRVKMPRWQLRDVLAVLGPLQPRVFDLTRPIHGLRAPPAQHARQRRAR